MRPFYCTRFDILPQCNCGWCGGYINSHMEKPKVYSSKDLYHGGSEKSGHHPHKLMSVIAL